MGNIDKVNSLFNAIEENDLSQAQSCLAGDFVYVGSVPMPLTGLEWLNFESKLLHAFPNLKFERVEIREIQNKVSVRFRVSGTHSGVLDLSDFGIDIIPPTGKSFNLPEEDATFCFNKGKIQSFIINEKVEGGVMAILNQIGLDLESKFEA